MNNSQNNRNLSKKKSGLTRLINPGVIMFLVSLLGIAALVILQNRSNNLREITGTSRATTQSSSALNNVLPANKASQLLAFDITKRSQPPISNESAYLNWMLLNTPEKKNYLVAKWQRAQAIIKNQDATDPRIIQAFLLAPREFFLPAGAPAASVYAMHAIPIGYGQTISGPHLVSRMTEAIDPQPGQKVLEIGTGSGYQSAVLAELANQVYSIEIVPPLAQKADAVYTKWSKAYPEYVNIKRQNADGYYGWAEYAPFDRIIVTAGIDHVPPDLLKQLAPDGIMVIPVGPPSGQTVLKISKQVSTDGSITYTREDIYHGRKVVFVPFTSGQGTHSTAADKTPNQ